MLEVLKYLLLAVEVLVAIMLIGIILLQRSKEQGLGLAFGSGMGEALFGAEAGNVLTKVTVILAIIFMVNTIALGKMFAARQAYGSVMSDVPSPASAAPAQPAGGSLPPNIPPPVEPTAGLPTDTAAPAMPAEVPAVPAAPVETPEMPAVPEVPAPAE